MTENKIEQTFNRSKVFLPVIHTIDKETILENIAIATDAEADGIFLINQHLPETTIMEFIPDIRDRYPELWIGVNLLGWNPSQVLKKYHKKIDGIWSDNAFHIGYKSFQETRETLRWPGLYFGGTAFKYQTEVPFNKLAMVSSEAKKIMDVVTTSGKGTGIPIDIPKLQEMRRGLGDEFAMAVASGTTVGNVDSLLPYLDGFLVATGIEEEFGKLNPKNTELMSLKIHSFKALLG